MENIEEIERDVGMELGGKKRVGDKPVRLFVLGLLVREALAGSV